jgi:hypothetical protein
MTEIEVPNSRVYQLFGAAKGLDFLHSENVVHGNGKTIQITADLKLIPSLHQ